MLFWSFFKRVHQLVGNRVYVLLFLAPIVTLLESIGILFFLPILNDDGFVSFVSKLPGFFSSVIYLFYTPGEGRVGLLVLVFLFFILKGMLLFFYQIYLANLRSMMGMAARSRFAKGWYRLDPMGVDKVDGESAANILTQQTFQMMQVFYQLMSAYSFFITTLVNSVLCLLVVFEFGVFSVFGFLLVYVFLKLIASQIKMASIEYTNGTQCLSKNISQDEAALKYLILSGAAIKRENLSNSIFHDLRLLERKRWSLQAMQNSLREPLALVVLGAAIWVAYEVFGLGFDLILVGCALLYKALNSALSGLANVNSAMEQFGGFNKWNNLIGNFEVDNSKNIEPKSFVWNELLLDSVEISYSGRVVLENVSLKIMRDSFVGISGPSGSGKTTLALSVLGFSNVSGGGIFFDGKPARETDFVLLRNQVGYVSQQTPIFEGSILENVTMSFLDEEVDTALVNQVLAQVGLLDYVNGLPGSIYYKISHASGVLSGGQRQRLLLARELYKRPTLLILDEPTSALDKESESEISSLLKKISCSCAIILISHSDKPLSYCKEILTIES